jgi:hypothetical protein
MHDAASEG